MRHNSIINNIYTTALVCTKMLQLDLCHIVVFNKVIYSQKQSFWVHAVYTWWAKNRTVL